MTKAAVSSAAAVPIISPAAITDPVLSITPPTQAPAIFVGRFIAIAIGGITITNTTAQTIIQAII